MKYLSLGLNLIKLSLNNLKRSPGRTLMLSISIGLTTMMINLIIAFYVGLNNQIIKSVVQSNVGDFQILDKKFDQLIDSSSISLLSHEQKRTLTSHFKSVIPQIVSNGFISSPEGNEAIQLVGDDFKFLFDSKILSLSGPLDGGVIIGKQLALDFKLNIGDTFIYNYQTKSDELKSELLTVQRIYDWNSMDFQGRFVYSTRKTVAQLLELENLKENAFQRIILRTDHAELIDKDIWRSFPDQETNIKSWKDINPEMATVIEFNGSLKGVLLLIIGLTVIITIMTPVNVTWNERLGELRSLNILGMSHGIIRIIGMFEALILSLGVGLLSSFLSFTIIQVFYRTGIDISFMNGGQIVERAGIEMPTIIYPIATSENLMLSFLFPLPVILICYFLAMNLPIRKLKESLK